MIKTTNTTYQAALTDMVCRHIDHKLESRFIENVLVRGNGYNGFLCVGFQKVDDQCFIIIGKRDWTTRFNAVTATDAIDGTGDWYSVSKEEGNKLYRYIKNNKQIGKNGKEYLRWDLDIQ